MFSGIKNIFGLFTNPPEQPSKEQKKSPARDRVNVILLGTTLHKDERIGKSYCFDNLTNHRNWGIDFRIIYSETDYLKYLIWNTAERGNHKTNPAYYRNADLVFLCPLDEADLAYYQDYLNHHELHKGKAQFYLLTDNKHLREAGIKLGIPAANIISQPKPQTPLDEYFSQFEIPGKKEKRVTPEYKEPNQDIESLIHEFIPSNLHLAAMEVIKSNVDPFVILDLEKEASIDKNNIHKAYKSKALKYHPDRRPNGDNEKFLQVTYAYELLSDEKARNFFQSGAGREYFSAYERMQTNSKTI